MKTKPKTSRWEDVTSYSRNEPHGADPRVWRTTLGPVRLTVHRHIHYPPDTWLASASGMFDATPLRAKDVGEAQIEALRMVREWCESVLREVGDVP